MGRYLKGFFLSYGHKPQRVFFEIPPCAKKVIFVGEFVILSKNLQFYEVKKNGFVHGEISKKRRKIIRPLFTIIFKPKIQKFHPYSICGVRTILILKPPDIATPSTVIVQRNGPYGAS